MSSRVQAKPYTSNIAWNFINVALVVSGLGGLLWLGFSEFNPDWLSYSVMYETGGAWLSEYGQAPIFLSLIALANHLIGPAGYESFRLGISFYFLFFSGALALGKIIPLTYSRWLTLQLPLAIISFGFTRFTVQIREGLATTFVLIGLACIIRADAAITPVGRQIFIWFGLALLGCAVLTHIGTIAIFIALLLALLSQRSGKIKAIRMKILWIFISVIGFILLGWVALGGMEEFGSAGSGISERVSYGEESSLTPLKFALWVCYGLVCFLVARAIRDLVSIGQLGGRLAATLIVTSGPVTFVALISIYVLIVIGAPAFYTGQYIRLLNLLLGINLLFIAANSQKLTIILFGSIFLIIYQIYSILDAVSIYSDLAIQ